jgi:hypothetical protein
MKPLLSHSAMVLVLVMLGSSPLRAQAAIVRPDRELTPEEAVLRTALYQFRDTVAALSGANSRMQRDFRATSDAALISRARQVKSWCDATARNLPASVAAVKAAPVQSSLQTKTQVRLLDSFSQLKRELTTCSTTFDGMAQPGQGEEVRGYANARLQALTGAILDYSRQVDAFFSALRIPNRPLGAKANPILG